MAMMHNPPHPGAALRDGVFDGDTISITAAAEALGVTRVTLSRVLNEQSGVSAEMALRLGKWLGTGPEVWLGMQRDYDLWHAEQALRKQVSKIAPLAVAA
ncbi:MAG: HigA family addiction module antitoxin [Casimicrobiaceae bacterium]